ncbi:hypothetical protein HBA_0351 [Sodalis endosymbiont of Henestaris halophilus]|nr:hypothetical protein HBA_0351 [Sodalis endosymbiont of Henestaris halophilus]
MITLKNIAGSLLLWHINLHALSSVKSHAIAAYNIYINIALYITVIFPSLDKHEIVYRLGSR